MTPDNSSDIFDSFLDELETPGYTTPSKQESKDFEDKSSTPLIFTGDWDTQYPHWIQQQLILRQLVEGPLIKYPEQTGDFHKGEEEYSISQKINKFKETVNFDQLPSILEKWANNLDTELADSYDYLLLEEVGGILKACENLPLQTVSEKDLDSLLLDLYNRGSVQPKLYFILNSDSKNSEYCSRAFIYNAHRCYFINLEEDGDCTYISLVDIEKIEDKPDSISKEAVGGLQIKYDSDSKSVSATFAYNNVPTSTFKYSKKGSGSTEKHDANVDGQDNSSTPSETDSSREDEIVDLFLLDEVLESTSETLNTEEELKSETWAIPLVTTLRKMLPLDFYLDTSIFSDIERKDLDIKSMHKDPTLKNGAFHTLYVSKPDSDTEVSYVYFCDNGYLEIAISQTSDEDFPSKTTNISIYTVSDSVYGNTDSSVLMKPELSFIKQGEVSMTEVDGFRPMLTLKPHSIKGSGKREPIVIHK